MLSLQLQERILAVTKEYWTREIGSNFFQQASTGREIGHRIADLVEENTTNLLESHFEHAHQRLQGQRRARGMGDIWIKEGQVFSPINVKSGEIGTNGQPNMVSLGKLVEALARREIDSYYLLFVKIGTPRSGQTNFHLYMVDLLDYLDYMSFNSGPGQIMLKEREFFAFMDSGAEVQARTLREKIERLHQMLIDANRRLVVARRNREAKIKRLIEQFQEGHEIDQSRLGLQ